MSYVCRKMSWTPTSSNRMSHAELIKPLLQLKDNPLKPASSDEPKQEQEPPRQQHQTTKRLASEAEPQEITEKSTPVKKVKKQGKQNSKRKKEKKVTVKTFI